MRFRVIVCSRCGRARGVRSDSKKASCSKCGASLDVKGARNYFSTDSEAELAKGVAEVNAFLQAEKGIDGDLEGISGHRCPGPSGGGRGTRGIEELILDLGRKEREFSFDSILIAVATSKGVDKGGVDEGPIALVIERMKGSGLLVEPRIGFFRLV